MEERPRLPASLTSTQVRTVCFLNAISTCIHMYVNKSISLSLSLSYLPHEFFQGARKTTLYLLPSLFLPQQPVPSRGRNFRSYDIDDPNLGSTGDKNKGENVLLEIRLNVHLHIANDRVDCRIPNEHILEKITCYSDSKPPTK